MNIQAHIILNTSLLGCKREILPGRNAGRVGLSKASVLLADLGFMEVTAPRINLSLAFATCNSSPSSYHKKSRLPRSLAAKRIWDEERGAMVCDRFF